MAKRMVILNFEKDYADEFDVKGFAFISLDQWEYYKKEAKNCEYPIESYFGSNEALVFESADEFIKSFKVKSITEMEMNIIKNALDMWNDEYGNCMYYALEGNASDEFYENNEYPERN